MQDNHNNEVVQQETHQAGKKPGEEMDRRIETALSSWYVGDMRGVLGLKWRLGERAEREGWSKSTTLKVARRLGQCIYHGLAEERDLWNQKIQRIDDWLKQATVAEILD
ncbi:MAG: hypothetical protein IT464_16590 [Planctomycetes bacterium]|nr:hypothetical protein [Planctomycetota bacterium]